MAKNGTIKLSIDASGVKKGANDATNELVKVEKSANNVGKRLQKAFSDNEGMIQAIQNINGVGDALENYFRKADKGGNMKQQLRNITQTVQQLEMQYRGLSAAEQQTAGGQALRKYIDELIKKGGDLKDTMVDVSNAITRQASDTAKLDSVVGGLQAMTAAAQVAGGAFGLLGINEETCEKIQADLVAVMSVANGLQTIQNQLQAESALMMGINAIQTSAAAAATEAKMVATNADNIVTKAAATLQWAWNAALAANPIAAVVIAVAALAAGLYVLTSRLNSVTPAEEGAAAAAEDMVKANSSGAQAAATAKLELEQYQRRIESFNGTAEDEKKLVEEVNNKYGEHIGYVKNLQEAKQALADAGQYYIQYLEAEAKAQALGAAYAKTYADMISGDIGYDEGTAKMETLKKQWDWILDDVNFYADMMRVASNLAGRSTTKPSSSSSSSRSSRTSSRSSSKKTTDNAPEYSLAWLNNQADEVQKKMDRIADINTTAGRSEWKKLNTELQYYKDMAAEIEKDKNVRETINKSIGDGVDSGLDALASKFAKLKPIKIPIDWGKKRDGLREQQDNLRTTASLVRNVGSILGEGAGAWANYASSVISSVSSALPQLEKMFAALFGTAAANAMDQNSKMGPWGWISGITAVASIIATMASIPKFATGGIVGGTSYSGDQMVARVNSGEMILNGAQQANLFHAINSGSIGGGQVAFKIKGQELYGVLKNYNSKMAKVR